MEQYSKQSAESAIASEHNVFLRARLKLTGIYVTILAIILFGFSAILIQSLGRNLTDASEENFPDIETHHHFVQDTLSTVRNEILLIDLLILIAAAGASYVLAGYTLRPIQRSLEAQRIFSENASHELRTPLAVMKNDAEVLLRNPNPTKERVYETLRSNIEEMDRMAQMAKDLLTLARSQNHITPVAEKVNITEIIRKTAEKMRSVGNPKGVAINVADGNPLYINGNRAGLERVIINLLQNAIEHTPKDGSVSIITQQEKNNALIEISDTGVGIEEKDLPHIFDRFYKGEGASGSGLGLSIVKDLVKQHSGRIEIESTGAKGTLVTIKLPLIA